MTKHYCDRCGKETSRVEKVSIPVEVSDESRGALRMEDKDLCPDCRQELKEFEKALYPSLALLRLRMFDNFMNRRSAAESLNDDIEWRIESKPEGIAKAKAIYKGFSNHDCASYYKCSVCGCDFDSYSVKREDPRCPGCKAVLEGVFK